MAQTHTQSLDDIYKQLPPEDQEVIDGVARLLWERRASTLHLPFDADELSRRQKEALEKISGVFSSEETDISENADKYLYE